jgi:hypothetical protein
VPPSPSTHMSQQRDKLYGCFGKAVNCLLFVSWVAGSREQAGINKAGEPTCQNVRCDALFREPDKISKVATIPKHYIPDDDQTPAVSEHLECQIDRAAGATLSFHSVIPASSLLHAYYDEAYHDDTACTMQVDDNWGLEGSN